MSVQGHTSGSNSRWLVAAAVAAALVNALPVAAAEDGLEEVAITGSRIVRRDLTASSPIVTVNTQSLENSSTTAVESVLQQLPQFVPGGNQFVSGAQAGAAQTPGIATLNLRGLGPNRNLVLVDGRRPQPANASLVVDINTIPQAAIQGVEVITGGASAVYGPDAIAGVTNFILKKNFEGLDVDAHYGITEQGDGSEQRISALMGMNSSDGRGNVMFSVDWTKRDAVYQRDRDFYVNGWRDTSNAGGDFPQAPGLATGGNAGLATNNPSAAALCGVVGVALSATGTCSVADVRFNNDGTAFAPGAGLGAAGYKGPLGSLDAGRFTMVNKLANGNFDQKYTTQFASTPLERHSLFMKGRYEVTDSVEATLQASYSNNKVLTRGNLAPGVTVWSVPVPRDGRTLPAALNTLLDSRPNPTAPWALFQVLDWFGPLKSTNTSNVWQVMAGLNGKLGVKDWTWEAYYSRGSTSTLSETVTPSLQRYAMLVNAPNFGKNAKITSPPTGVLAGRGYQLDCTSGIPVFNEFTPSADCLNSVQTRTRQITELTQDILEANVQGGAFDLPAGESRFALGVSYRANDFRFDPGYPVEQIMDNPIGLFASNGTKGSTNVKEAYGEVLLPIVKDLPFVKALDLELGYRLSDFDTAGNVNTYKGLFTWKALDSVTFRGGYNYATRAPNTAELFTGPTLLVVPFPEGDYCSVTTQSKYGNVASNPDRAKVQALCQAIIGNTTTPFSASPSTFSRPGGPAFFPLEIEVTKGNPKVGPETAQTFTFGAVLSEPFGAPNLVVTADYYQIKVTDAIAPISSTTVYGRCFNPETNPTYSVTNEACQLIARNPITGDREQTIAAYSNLGTINTSGIDMSLAWSHEVGPGNFAVNTTLSWLSKYDYQPVAGGTTNVAKGTLDQGGQYDYRLLTNFSYRVADINLGLQWRHLPAVESAAKGIAPTTTQQGTGTYDVFGLNASYNMGKVTFRAGIDNLLNKAPPSLNYIPGGDSNTDNTNPSFYDILGRRFFVGVKAKL